MYRMLTVLACLVVVVFLGVVDAEETAPVKSLDQLDWMVGTWKGETSLGPFRPDLGPMGTPAKFSVTWRRDLKGMFLVGETAIEVGGKGDKDAIVMVMRDPAENVLKFWQFILPGVVFHGTVVSDDSEKLITWTGEGKAFMGGKASGKMVYTRKGNDEIAMQFTDVKIANLKLPTESPVTVLKRQSGQEESVSSKVEEASDETTTSASDKAAQEDLAKLQGKWEARGKTVRNVKSIEGDKETITRYNNDGDVTSAHTTTINLRVKDGLRLFTFSGLEMTEGPQKGQKWPITGGYIYRIDGDKLYEIRGTVGGMDGKPRVVTWTRVKE